MGILTSKQTIRRIFARPIILPMSAICIIVRMNGASAFAAARPLLLSSKRQALGFVKSASGSPFSLGRYRRGLLPFFPSVRSDCGLDGLLERRVQLFSSSTPPGEDKNGEMADDIFETLDDSGSGRPLDGEPVAYYNSASDGLASDENDGDEMDFYNGYYEDDSEDSGAGYANREDFRSRGGIEALSSLSNRERPAVLEYNFEEDVRARKNEKAVPSKPVVSVPVPVSEYNFDADLRSKKKEAPVVVETPPSAPFDEIMEIALPAPVPRFERSERTAASPDTSDFFQKASGGSGYTDSILILETRLDLIKKDLFALNGNKTFNPNSPRQVADILYHKSDTDRRTSKDVLDAMAGAGNAMADKVLQYRACRSELKKDMAKRDRQQTQPSSSFSSPPNNLTKSVGNATENRDPLLLIDASAFIFRAYHAMPPLHRSDGTPVGAVLGFCNMINRLILHRLIAHEQPRMALIFDHPGKNLRHEMFEDYKANRPPCPMDLVPQFDLVREAAHAYGIQSLEAKGYEADDVIATIAKFALERGVNVNVISSDKDLMQLVTPTESTTSLVMIDPMKMTRIDNDAVVEKWGVPPHLLGDLLAMAGDSADNVPGISGIGPKIAAVLLQEYGTLEGVLENAEGIKQKGRREKIIKFQEDARLSRKLVELHKDVSLDLMDLQSADEVCDIRTDPLDEERLLQFYGNMGFGDLKKRTAWKFRNDNVPKKTNDDGNSGGSWKKKSYEKKGGKSFYKDRNKLTAPPKPEDYEDLPF